MIEIMMRIIIVIKKRCYTHFFYRITKVNSAMYCILRIMLNFRAMKLQFNMQQTKES